MRMDLDPSCIEAANVDRSKRDHADRSDINQRTNLMACNEDLRRARSSLAEAELAHALATDIWPPILPRYASWPSC